MYKALIPPWEYYGFKYLICVRPYIDAEDMTHICIPDGVTPEVGGFICQLQHDATETAEGTIEETDFLPPAQIYLPGHYVSEMMVHLVPETY